MSSWTKKQISILMEWVEENNEFSEKSIWTKRYYDFLYLLLYFPSIIITSYLSAKNDTEIIIPIIINQTITTFDKFFNFGKLAGEYENYANLYQNFSDRILEELVKPESVKQNGTIFYHDMNLEKQRLGDKTRPIPWIVEKVYNYYKKKKTNQHHECDGYGNHDDGSSTSSIVITNDNPPRQAPVVQESFTIAARPRRTSSRVLLYNETHHNAARVIQNAWYNWCVRNNKMNYVHSMEKRRLMPRLVTDTVHRAKNRIVKNNGTNKSSINLMIINPQTKMEKKLAKMIHEKEIIHEEPELSFQLARFNENFANNENSVYDETIDAVRKKKNVRLPSFL